MTLWQLVICRSRAVARAGLISCPTFHKLSPVIPPKLKFIAPLRTLVSDSKDGEGCKDDNDYYKKGEDYNAKYHVTPLKVPEVTPSKVPDVTPPNELVTPPNELVTPPNEPVKIVPTPNPTPDPPKWDFFLNLGAFISCLGTVIFGITTYRAHVRAHEENSINYQVQRAVREIMTHKVTLPPMKYVARPSVDKQLKNLFSSEHGKIFTNVIIGVRGFGKTTSVLKAFEETEGVLQIKGTYITFDEAMNKLLSHLKVTSGNDSWRHVAQVLRQLPSKGPKPTFIFDIDERMKSEEVEKLILWAKNWGADQSVARVVLVFSGAMAAYSHIEYGKLRCSILEIKEASREEIVTYFEENMKGVSNVDKEYLASKVGGSFLEAEKLIQFIVHSSSKDCIDSYFSMQETELKSRIRHLWDVLQITSSNRKDRRARIDLLDELAEGNRVDVVRFAKAFDLTKNDLKIKLEERPRVLYFNIEDNTVEIKYSALANTLHTFIVKERQ